MTTLQTYSVGTKVKIITSDEEIKGQVIAVWVGANEHVKYQVVWWNGNARCCEYFEDYEVKPIGRAKSLKIGFLPKDTE